MTLGEVKTYIWEQYHIKWSLPHIRKLAREGIIEGRQIRGEHGWWYVTKESIDQLLNP